MDTATHQQWLTDTRRFWNAGSEFEAKYRRICLSPEIDATEDEARLGELWEQETAAAIPRLLHGIPLEAHWTCLEIGCGIGRLMKPLARRCRRVIGVDLSEKMATWAREYLADLFADRNALGPKLAARAAAGLADEEEIALSCEVLARQLLERWR